MGVVHGACVHGGRPCGVSMGGSMGGSMGVSMWGVHGRVHEVCFHGGYPMGGVYRDDRTLWSLVSPVRRLPMMGEFS